MTKSRYAKLVALTLALAILIGFIPGVSASSSDSFIAELPPRTKGARLISFNHSPEQLSLAPFFASSTRGPKYNASGSAFLSMRIEGGVLTYLHECSPWQHMSLYALLNCQIDFSKSQAVSRRI